MPDPPRAGWRAARVERGRFRGWWRVEGPPLSPGDDYVRTVGYVVRRADAEAIVAAMASLAENERCDGDS